MSISPKLTTQAGIWKNVMTCDPTTLADCKAKTYEYGDALISHDVVCDEFKERKEGDRKLETEQHQPPLERLQQEKKNLKKKENVMMSELPVAKNKWGVKLRHVITCGSKRDDKTEQPNFRKSKSGPSSTLYEEYPQSNEDFNQLWHSKSNELILDSQNKEDSDKLEFMSVFQRMKSFELNSKSKPVENATVTNDAGTKPLSLEDLLNLDKQVLSVNVIDKSCSPVADRGNIGYSKSCSNINSHESNEQYSSATSKKYLCNRNKRSLINVLLKDADNYSTKVFDDSTSKMPVNNISTKKTSVFGKIRSKHSKKAISLEELLKMDEQNLSVDVVDKTKCHDIEGKVLDYKTDPDYANLSHAECGQSLNKAESDISQKDCSSSSEWNLRTIEATEEHNQLESNHHETTINSSSPQQRKSPKVLPSGSPGLNVKEKMKNEKLAIDVTKNDPTIKYNKLGQIILKNDTMFEPELRKAKSEAETFVYNNNNVSNGEIKHSSSINSHPDWKTDHHTNDSDAKYNELGQINGQTVNGLIETDIPMCHESINNKNIELLNGVGSSVFRKSDSTKQLSLKKSKYIYEINQNQNINSVKNVDPTPKIYLNPDPKMAGGDHGGIVTHTSKESVEAKKNQINYLDPSQMDIVDNFKATVQLNGVSVDTDNKALEEIDSKNQICNNSYQTKKSDLNINNIQISKKKPDNQGYDQKSKYDTNISIIKQEKLEKIPSETKIADQNSVDHESESISPPINRKVGKLIIMTGEQRNEQLKSKQKPQLRNFTSKHIYYGKLDSTDIEELKKNHKEGFSLTFMSNELEDDGVPDIYPIPEIVFNEKVVKLKSMMHTQKNRTDKHVQFNSYPAEESFFEDGNDIGNTKVDDMNSELSFTTEFYTNMKTYEANNSFDFGSVIQRERQRFNSMDEENLNPKDEFTFDQNTDGDHFNSHHNQHAGHALLF